MRSRYDHDDPRYPDSSLLKFARTAQLPRLPAQAGVGAVNLLEKTIDTVFGHFQAEAAPPGDRWSTLKP